MKKIAMALMGAAALSCAAWAAVDKAAIQPWGFDLSGMDRSVKPGDDFFEYANGNWFKRTTIPGDRTSIGSFQQLRIDSENRMKALIAEWEQHDKLRDGRPYRYFPGAWRAYQAALLRADQGLRVARLDPVGQQLVGIPALAQPYLQPPPAELEAQARLGWFTAIDGHSVICAPEDHHAGYTYTPHRYPRTVGADVSAAIHHGFSVMRVPNVEDVQWIISSPSEVAW